ncbi:hypothetical protein [Bradyrhizobium sp. CCBAU 45384]|uniref:hypothetical protein n=1 Tax=Bradyrhizobium sp. CCBAU 45384 TaxID=858428 RepID=UPI0023055437|nr:hypothetical protein [Bradyrhizobium sp. CCBAU 45384]
MKRPDEYIAHLEQRAAKAASIFSLFDLTAYEGGILVDHSCLFLSPLLIACSDWGSVDDRGGRWEAFSRGPHMMHILLGPAIAPSSKTARGSREGSTATVGS